MKALFGLLLLVSGCATPYERGPSMSEFARLISRDRETPRLRHLRCEFYPEEGTEWTCRYQEQASSGAWVDLSAAVAIDGNGWLLNDSICTAEEALADRERCAR